MEEEGWVIAGRSWAAQLDSSRVSQAAISALLHHDVPGGELRDVRDADVAAVLALDAATCADYPGGIATRHVPLTETTAKPSPTRGAFGMFTSTGCALGVTYLDRDGTTAETDFTVVSSDWRGRGIGRALKAAAVLTLVDDGVCLFRTGGAMENAPIIAINDALGYVRDEEWLTLVAPRVAAGRAVGISGAVAPLPPQR